MIIIITTTFILISWLLSAPRLALLLDQATSSPDGTPCADLCLFGIYPGATLTEDARLLLRAHPLTGNAQWIAEDVLKLPDSDEYVFIHATPGGVVDRIGMTAMMDDTASGDAADIGTRTEGATLDQFMLRFGAGDILFQGNAFVALPDTHVGVVAVTSQSDLFTQHVRLDAPITSLTVTVIPLCREPQFGADNTWQALVSLKRAESRRASLRITAYRYAIPALGVCWG